MEIPAGDNIFVYRFGERITIENTDRHIAEINQRFDAPEVKRIIFDLENVRECSSYGLRMFLIFLRRADAGRKLLFLYKPQPAMFELLKITRLDQVFKFTDKIDGE